MKEIGFSIKRCIILLVSWTLFLRCCFVILLVFFSFLCVMCMYMYLCMQHTVKKTIRKIDICYKEHLEPMHSILNVNSGRKNIQKLNELFEYIEFPDTTKLNYATWTCYKQYSTIFYLLSFKTNARLIYFFIFSFFFLNIRANDTGELFHLHSHVWTESNFICSKTKTQTLYSVVCVVR